MVDTPVAGSVAGGGAEAERPTPPMVVAVDVALRVEARSLPRFERPLEVGVRQAALLQAAPWVRSAGKVALEVTTQGWRFPAPPDQPLKSPRAVTDRPPPTLAPVLQVSAPEIDPEAEVGDLPTPSDTLSPAELP